MWTPGIVWLNIQTHAYIVLRVLPNRGKTKEKIHINILVNIDFERNSISCFEKNVDHDSENTF